MFDRYDQSQLLELIEQELEPAAAAQLRERLEADPEAAAMIEQMRQDRAMLQAEAEPSMPADFAAQLEPMLVRPMLMESLFDTPPSGTSPGQERRRHRRVRRRRVIGRFAIAALVTLVASAGVWTGFQTLGPRASEPVALSRAADRPEALATAAADAIAVDDAAVIHHYLPPESPGFASNFDGDVASRERDSGEEASDGGGGAKAVEIVLVVEAADPADAEQQLSEIVARMQEPHALVQNFSYNEAIALEQQWMTSAARRAEAPPVPGLAASDSRSEPPAQSRARYQQLADRALSQQAAGDALPQLSSQLVGVKSLAPPLVQQLEFSSRGATHTVAIPRVRVQELLAELASTSQLTSLQQLPAEGAEARPAGPMQWALDRFAVQAALRELDAPDDEVIHLPVIIKKKHAD